MLGIFSKKDVSDHNRVNDAWVIFNGKVYDVTTFLQSHPGGLNITEQYLGSDISDVIQSEDVHLHSSTALEILQQYLIGTVKNSKVSDQSCSKEWEEDDIIDWSKPLFQQIPSVGKHYPEWVHSPVNRKLRLFESDFVEFFSKAPWWLIPLIWFPVVLYICYLALTGSRSYLPTLGSAPPLTWTQFGYLLPTGTILWTFIEYSLHRFVFHLNPHLFWMKLHFLLHGMHHKVPFDHTRLVFPPIPATITMLALYIPIAHLVPITVNESRGLLAGALIGYVLYDLTHYYLHHGNPVPQSYLGSLKTYHAAHHYINHNLGFGISSKFWDIPFHTLLTDTCHSR